uniref:Uncharacterized protein n=1 Tax=Romanomermis culicivorax TaxID=13658 RepID=A0A915I1H4_ROMCU
MAPCNCLYKSLIRCSGWRSGTTKFLKEKYRDNLVINKDFKPQNEPFIDPNMTTSIEMSSSALMSDVKIESKFGFGVKFHLRKVGV